MDRVLMNEERSFDPISNTETTVYIEFEMNFKTRMWKKVIACVMGLLVGKLLILLVLR